MAKKTDTSELARGLVRMRNNQNVTQIPSIGTSGQQNNQPGDNRVVRKYNDKGYEGEKGKEKSTKPPKQKRTYGKSVSEIKSRKGLDNKPVAGKLPKPKKTASPDASKSSKDEVVGRTRSQIRKDNRMTKRATRRADRTGRKDPSAVKGTDQYAANLSAEEGRIKTNRLKRRKFATDLANAAGSGDAEGKLGSPRVKRSKDEVTKAMSAEDMVSAVGTNAQAEQLKADMTNVGTEVPTLGETNDNSAGIQASLELQNEYKDQSYVPISPAQKRGNDPDSTPSSAMRNMYFKKKGY